MDPKQFVGALYDPVEGHLDPYGTTHAYAKSAKKNGAEIYLHTKVEDLVQREDGSWRVITNKGEIIAEHIVNAAGLWAREVGRMLGLELPVLAMEHMYLITEDMPEVTDFNARSGKELMHCVDFDGEIYLRQERKGMLMGTYEKACRPWSPITTPWDFGHELLPQTSTASCPELEVGFRHFPAFNKAGIRKIINGPFTFSPDGNPLVGPVRGLRNCWSACGVMAGFSQGGGVGLALANWMMNGDPGFDVWAMDVARYGDWATLAYTNAKVRENYSRRFSIRFPNEELPAGAAAQTTPIYDRLKDAGASLRRLLRAGGPLWFAPQGRRGPFSWRRSTDFDTVGDEGRAVRNGVGLMETSGFAKYTVKGPGAEAWLDQSARPHCRKPARMTLAPMLKHDGRLIGDFTLAKLGEGEFLIIGSGIAEDYHMRWFEQHLPDGWLGGAGSGRPRSGRPVDCRSASSRAAAKAHPCSTCRMRPSPSWTIRRMDVGMARPLSAASATPAISAMRSGCGRNTSATFHDLLMAEGARIRHPPVRPAGAQLAAAGKVLRQLVARIPSDLHGTGSGAVALRRAEEGGRFHRQAGGALPRRKPAGKLRLRTFIVDAKDADVIGDEPICFKGEVRGWVTSGGYAHAAGKAVALGYVPKEIAIGNRRLVHRASRRPSDCPAATPADLRCQRLAHAQLIM